MKILLFPALLAPIVALCLSGPVSAAGGPASEQWAPETLTYYAENFPPANYLEGDKLTGITVESLRLMWRVMGVPEQPIRVVPWLRGYREALRTPGAVLFTMSRTPAREALFKWVGPIFVAHHVLIARNDFDVVVSSMADVSDFNIAVVRGDITNTELIEAGHSKDHTRLVTQRKQAVEMLNRGRVDLIMMSLIGFKQTVAQQGYAGTDYKPVMRTSSLGNYIAFHRDTPDALVKRFQKAFEQTRDQRQTLQEKYGTFGATYASGQ